MSTASCPRCTGELVDSGLPAREGVFFTCPTCDGHWLDNVACERLVHVDVSADVHDLLRRKAKASEFTGGMAGYRTAARRGSEIDDPTPCAICNVMTISYVTDPNVFGARVRLDVCAEHGTWFDKGEAWTLLQAATLRRADSHMHPSQPMSADARASWSAEWLAINAESREHGE